MGRAGRARRIAATAAYGGGGLAAAAGALGALGYGLIQAEARLARKVVGRPFDEAPEDDGVYGAAAGPRLELVVLGDSSAAGMGADHPHETVGAIIASGLAAMTGRPVRVTNEARVGAESSDLGRQLANALDRVERPDVAIVLVGANDVTHRIDRSTSVRHLEQAVRRLRAAGVEVVVGTCPDLGTVEPVPHPLRLLLRRWSRDLAAAQTVAVVEAGGRTVSLADLLGHEFSEHPADLFSKDRFHPSAAGYARVASVLLPSVCAALGVWQAVDAGARPPEPRRGETVSPVAVAAGQAVKDPGTEVSATDLAGTDRGPRGRWAVLLRRRHDPAPGGRTEPRATRRRSREDASADGPAGAPPGVAVVPDAGSADPRGHVSRDVPGAHETEDTPGSPGPRA